MKKILSYLFLTACAIIVVKAQSDIPMFDSLKRQVLFMPEDSTKAEECINLSKKYFKIYEDSTGFALLDSALIISRNQDYLTGVAKYWDTKGYVFRNRSKYREALDAHFKALKLAEELSLKALLPRINNNIGVVYRRLDEYESGVDYHLKALKCAEQIGDQRSKMYAENSLGNIYNLMGQVDDAMKYFNIALQRAIETGNKRSQAINYNNIGEVYEKRKDYERALEYYFKSLEINIDQKSLKGVSICYDCIGSVYFYQEDHDKAISYFEKALELNKQLKDDRFIVVSGINIGKAYYELKDYRKSLLYLKRGLNLSLDIGAKSTSKEAFNYLAKVSEELNQHKQALHFYREYSKYKDSILNEESSKTINKLQILYDTEKQRKEIELLEQEKIQKERTSKRKSIFIGLLVLVIGLIGILAIILFRSTKSKQRTNEQLVKQSKEISDKNEELEKQKQQLEYTNLKITDSLQYAKKIQQALLPKDELLQSLFLDYFVFFQPMSAVSGDFYWVSEHGEKIIFAAVDCTGHGVPGAMMSMLGNSYLNEAVRMSELKDVSIVLDEIRTMIIESLHQQGMVGESRDGMDMAICSYCKTTGVLEFSGAHNPLWILRMQDDGEYDIVEIKGDPMPVSFSRRMKPFTKHSLELRKNDRIYLFSDGFIDQFGGVKGRRFMRKPFKELLINNAEKSFKEQKEILIDAFNTWKQSNEQIDDVLVMGVKIK